MNFYYLNLPKVPEEFTQLCLDKIPLRDIDPILLNLNKHEGTSHSITYLPHQVKTWLNDNIIPKIDPTLQHYELFDRTYLHINEYIEHKNGSGIHPIHIDYGRKWAFNYILTAGAEDLPLTTWYQNDRETIIEEHKIEVARWHLIAVNPIWHGVKGQRKGQLRTIISLCYDSKDSSFDPEIIFKDIIIK